MKKYYFLALLLFVFTISKTVNAQCPPPVFDAVSPITIAWGDPIPTHTLNYSNGELGPCNISGTVTSTITGQYNDTCTSLNGGQFIETWSVFYNTCNLLATTSRTIFVSPTSIIPPVIIDPLPDITINCGSAIPSGSVHYSNGLTGPCAISGNITWTSYYPKGNASNFIVCDTTLVETFTVPNSGVSRQRTIHINSYAEPSCPPPSLYSWVTNCTCSLGTNGTMDYQDWNESTVTTHPCCIDGLGLKIHTDPYTNMLDIHENGAGCGDNVKLWFCDGKRNFVPFPNPLDVKMYRTDLTAGTPEEYIGFGPYQYDWEVSGIPGHVIRMRAHKLSTGFQSSLDVTIPSNKPVQCNLTLEASGLTNVNSGCDNQVSVFLTNHSGEQADCPSSMTLNACGQTYTYGYGESPSTITAPPGIQCTVSGSYICKGQTCPLQGVVVQPPIQDSTCNDLIVNAYIAEYISLPCTPFGKIQISAYSQSCIEIPINIQFYRDSSGFHLNETTFTNFSQMGGSHLFENLPKGKYVINFNQVGFGCSKKISLYLGLPYTVNSTVYNLAINTITGNIDSIPLSGVIVDAYNNSIPGEILETAISDQDGHFSFITLDSASFYKLNFHYQDQNGIDLDISSNYEYTGYKFMFDTVGVIALPYSILIQTRQLVNKILNKPNYEINFSVLGFATADINVPIGLPRKVYYMLAIDSLINDWRTIDKVEAIDVISNLERVYLSLYANNELSEDAYKLCKEPPKALSALVMTLAGLIPASTKLGQASAATGTSVHVLQELEEAAAMKVLDFVMTKSTNILKERLLTLKDQHEKESVSLMIKGIQTTALIIKRKPNITSDDIKGLVSDVLVNEFFILSYYNHILLSQRNIDDTYQKAIALVPPEESFHTAFEKVMLDDNTSLVSNAHEQTSIVLYSDSLLYDNVSQLKTVESALGIVKAYGDLQESEGVLDLLSYLNKVTKYSFGAFKLTNYATATYLSMARISDNRREQFQASTLSWSPFAQFSRPISNFNITTLSNRQVPLSNGLLNSSISVFNTKLDSIIYLIQNNRNLDAAVKTKELFTLDSLLENDIHLSTKEIEAKVQTGDSLIPGFYDLYSDSLVEQLNSNTFSRTELAFNLGLWFLDTTATTFVDTLQEIITRVKVDNTVLDERISYMSSLVSGIQIPAKVMITGVNAPHEVDTSSTQIVHLQYKNFGIQSADSAYARIETERGFIAATDSIYIGSILPGTSGEINFTVNTPAVDTFMVYRLLIFLKNGEGDFYSDYLISNIPNKHCTFYYDLDSDGFGGDSANNIIMDHCIAPLGLKYSSLDCNDSDPSINPGSLEICNGIDDNCNGQTDDIIAKLIAVNPYSPQLYIYDPASVLEEWIPNKTISLSLSGFTITGTISASIHPFNNNCYAIVKISGSNSRRLVTVNTTTGVCTLIGNLGDNFSSITYAPDGRLFAVTGDGASVPETLYEINTINASKTFKKTLGNGNDGVVIAFNKDDGFIYHWSGSVFEKIDTSMYSVSNIVQSGYARSETFGAVYKDSGTFIISNLYSDLVLVNTLGQNTYLANTSSNIRGFGINLSNNIAPTVPILTSNSTVVCNTSALLNISSGSLNNGYHWQWYSGNCGGTPIGSGNVITVSPTITTTYYARGEGTCISPACGSITVTVSCGATLNMKVFIQGLYNGNGSMTAVIDPVNHPLISDSITVELHDTIAPYNVVSSRSGTLSITGNGQFVFPPEMFGHAYYIVVRHRNSIETWSKAPVVLGLNTSFDFTSSE